MQWDMGTSFSQRSAFSISTIPTQADSFSLYRSLSFFTGRRNIKNPMTIDPRQLCSRTYSTSVVASYVNDMRADPSTANAIHFVVCGMVVDSSLEELVGEKRKVKFVSLLLPTTCLDRLQTCLNIAFDKWDGALCSNIRDTGLEFSTRGRFVHCFQIVVFSSFPAVGKNDTAASPKKGAGQRVRSRPMGEGSEPIYGGSRQLTIGPYEYGACSTVFGELELTAAVPRFDARKRKMDLNSAQPHLDLPKYEGEFERGDIIWCCFTSNCYTRENNEFAGSPITAMNIKWAVLLSRTGMEGYDAVYQPSSDAEA